MQLPHRKDSDGPSFHLGDLLREYSAYFCILREYVVYPGVQQGSGTDFGGHTPGVGTRSPKQRTPNVRPQAGCWLGVRGSGSSEITCEQEWLLLKYISFQEPRPVNCTISNLLVRPENNMIYQVLENILFNYELPSLWAVVPLTIALCWSMWWCWTFKIYSWIKPFDAPIYPYCIPSKF
jgi:hypothetical protein